MMFCDGDDDDSNNDGEYAVRGGEKLWFITEEANIIVAHHVNFSEIVAVKNKNTVVRMKIIMMTMMVMMMRVVVLE